MASKWKWLWSSYWNRQRNKDYRCRYRRKPCHKKKQRNVTREDWREKKQFSRDRARNGWRYEAVTKWERSYGMKQWRRIWKQQLHQGRWDDWRDTSKWFLRNRW